MNWSKESLRLYAVTDRSWLNGRTLAESVNEALRGGATCVQLREKALNRDDFLAEALELTELCHSCGVPLIVNDDVEIARLSGADGVHVGQEDMDVREVRKVLGKDKIVGVTAKTVRQALDAQAAGASYLGSGAVFGSSTKKNALPMTKELLCEICAAVEIPVVAIGGINRSNLKKLAGTGIAGAAIVSGIFAAHDIEGECRQLRALIEEVIRAR